MEKGSGAVPQCKLQSKAFQACFDCWQGNYDQICRLRLIGTTIVLLCVT